MKPSVVVGRTAVLTTFTVAALLLALPSIACAYVDPGSGAFIYQALYAVLLGGAFQIRKFLNRLLGKKNK